MNRQEQFLRCKTFGHSWSEYNPPQKLERKTWFARITLRCACTTTRHDYIDRNGEVERRKYHWPDGYRTAKGETKPTRSELRLMVVKANRALARSKQRKVS